MNFFARVFRSHDFKMMVLIAIFYASLSFLYSFIGFLHYQPGNPYQEFALDKLIVEIGGHFVFGFIAALPLKELRISILTGSLAVLIDVDHLLSIMNFDVSGRPDHSILYATIAAVLMFYVGRELKFSKDLFAKFIFVAPVSMLAHISYDILVSPGTTFQFLIPFSFQQFEPPHFTWTLFEVAALLLSLVGLYFSRTQKPVVERLPKGQTLEPDKPH